MTSEHHTTNTSPQSSPDVGLPSLYDALTLQQYYFEQSLASEKLRFKKLVDEQEASIKAAVKETAARATKVGKILIGDKDAAPKEKVEEFDSQWPKSRSPTRYKKECKEHKDRSSKDTTSHGHHRRSSDHDCWDDHKHHNKSSHRRNRYFSGGKNDSNYHQNKGRHTTRRRSRSRSPTRRHHPVDSSSPGSGYFRSELHDSRCYKPSRVTGSHSMSRSPINDYSVRNRTQQSKDINMSIPKVSRRSPSIENFLSNRSAGLQVDDSGYYVNQNFNASKQLERKGTPRRELLLNSKSSSRSICSLDYFGERTTEAINVRKDLWSAPGGGKHPAYVNTDGRLSPVTSGCIKNFMDSPGSSLPKFTGSMDYSTQTDRLSHIEDVGNGHDGKVKSEHELLNVTVKEVDVDDSNLPTQQEVFNHEVDVMHVSDPANSASIYSLLADPSPNNFKYSKEI
ncbi:uncharacterized protein LOC111988245 isoform X2 [Quercus suber]|uniref:uncharacterized protein LOC111988245 isoform X2 n=1 Tax=Quercus suber TaxID=58331 RepID=UPI0032DF6437